MQNAAEPTPETLRDLVRAAARARRHACAPWSGFRVGAAVLARDGRVFTGANVESASLGLTCCAERVALFKALTEGAGELVAVAVVAAAPGGPRPCGACRQLLAEYAPAAVICCADSRRPARFHQFDVARLLPEAFLRF